jgi:hypothetical protein
LCTCDPLCKSKLHSHATCICVVKEDMPESPMWSFVLLSHVHIRERKSLVYPFQCNKSLHNSVLTRVSIQNMYILHYYANAYRGLKIRILGHSVLHTYLNFTLFFPKYCLFHILRWQFQFHSSSSPSSLPSIIVTCAVSRILRILHTHRLIIILTRQFFLCVMSVKC